MHRAEILLENEKHKVLLDFKIQTDPQSRPQNQT